MTEVRSAIEKVTIYAAGATVLRRFELARTGDVFPEEVEVPGLPLSLADGSVKVRVRSAEGGAAAPVAADLRVGLHVAPKAAQPEAPDEAALRRTLRALDAKAMELSTLEAEIEMLGSMEVPARPEPEEGKPPPPSPMAARLALESFVDEGISKRRERVEALRAEVREAERERADLEARLVLASSAETAEAQEVTKSVFVRLRHAEGVARAELELEYFVPGVRWAPAYQVRLAADARSARIQLRALICQDTGEDWRRARLSLSTAHAVQWTELPELSAIRIGKAQDEPRATRGFRPPPRGARALFQDYDSARALAQRLVPKAAAWARPHLELTAPSAALLDHPRMVSQATLDAFGGAVAGAAAEELDASFDMDDEMEEAPAMGGAMEPMMMASIAPPSPPAPEPMAAPAPASRAMRKMRSRPADNAKKGAARHGGGGPADDSGLVEALTYTQLELGPPEASAKRQALTPIDRPAFYRRTIQRSGLHVDFDVEALVQAACRRAERAAGVRLPPDATAIDEARGRYDYVYAADDPVDVPSDGAFHSVPLGGRTSACQVRYIVVPREDPNVYRIAKIDNPGAAPLLAGPTEVYVGSEYVLSTQLPHVPPNGELELGLGVEQAIKCARNTTFIEKRSSDKVVATNELVHDIRIELVNNLDRDIECEVRERIPQPADDAEVVVEEHEVEPAWEPYKQEEHRPLLRGGRRWQLSVPARSKRELQAEYVVKIYANNEIVGGNRRES